MKKIVAGVLVVLCALSLFTACSSTNTKDQTPTPTPTPSLPVSSESVNQATPSLPEVTPSPSPIPTPTPTPSDEKKEGAPMTEEELGVLPVGQYVITPVGTTTPISYAKALPPVLAVPSTS